MNLQETAKLLGVMASVDRRKVGQADVLVWNGFLRDYSYRDCEQAVLGFFRDSREWLMPADVVQRVRQIRAERLKGAGTPLPPEGQTVAEWQAWLKETQKRVADGTDGPRAIEGPQ